MEFAKFLKQARDDWKSENALQDVVVKDAWADWLSENWEWEWYVTLTFRESVGVRRANSLWQLWYKQLVGETKKDVQYVRFEEWQRLRGVPHYHALMLNVKHVRRVKWNDRWAALAGWARVQKYDSNRGAAYYVSKYVVKDMGNIRFSDSLQDYAKWSDRPIQLEFS